MVVKHGCIGHNATTSSVTIEAWVYLPADYPLTKMPIVSNLDGSLSMYLEGGRLTGSFGASSVQLSTQVIPAWSWTHLVFRYDAEGGCGTSLY
jgi:hypothetical protein